MFFSIIPWNYIAALLTTLLLLLDEVLDVYGISVTSSKNGKADEKTFLIFFVAYCWTWVLLGSGVSLLKMFLCLVVGAIFGFCNYAYKRYKAIKENSQPKDINDIIGQRGTIIEYIANKSERGKEDFMDCYLGRLLNNGDSILIYFRQSDILDAGTDFEVTGFENGKFVASLLEKISN